MAWRVVIEKMMGLPCFEPPSPPLSAALTPNAALPKSVPFWEMLHLPAAPHFPVENASSLQPFQLAACGHIPFWGDKPKKAEKSCFLGQGFRGARAAELGWGAVP